MKILILTHPLETNYGGILQNFALQHVLKGMGHDVLTIDCHHDKTFLYKVISWMLRLIRHYFFSQQHIPINYNIHKSGKRKLRENPELWRFIKENIQLTKYIPSYSKLYISLDYNPDCIVVGSDQVWLKQYYPYTFLNFAQHSSCKKVAYAASGEIEWLRGFQKLEEAKKYISSFNALSVRENIMVEKSMNFLGAHPECVLDPVFLVEKDVYIKLIGGSYRFVNILATYILDECPSKVYFINQVAARKNLTLYKTYQTGVSENIPALEQWLSAIACSDFVITDSYHGMVLSIIFNKQFVVIGNSKRGLERFYTVLEKFNLKSRFLNEELLCEGIVSSLPLIDYQVINKQIREEKSKSINFLKRSLMV